MSALSTPRRPPYVANVPLATYLAFPPSDELAPYRPWLAGAAIEDWVDTAFYVTFVPEDDDEPEEDGHHEADLQELVLWLQALPEIGMAMYFFYRDDSSDSDLSYDGDETWGERWSQKKQLVGARGK